MTGTSAAAERRRAQVQRQIDDALQAYKERITRILHEAAEEHSLCDAFDDVMEEIDLPRREHKYRVRVDVALEMYVVVKASSENEAEQTVREDDSHVVQHLWTVQPDEVEDYTITVGWVEKEDE